MGLTQFGKMPVSKWPFKSDADFRACNGLFFFASGSAVAGAIDAWPGPNADMSIAVDYVVACLLPHSLVLMTFCFHPAATTCSKHCYCSESDGGGKTLRCSNRQLTAIPHDIPNDTRRVYLDFNLLTSIPANAFAGLSHLAELDLSHNDISQLQPGAFRGLSSSLQSLDLSATLCDCHLV